MKKIIHTLWNYLQKKFNSFHKELSEEVVENQEYTSLSPIDNGDEKGHYSKALEWAINNRQRENIKNIAITGPYGSGKSSILKTFQKNNKRPDLEFLNISLATFKEEKIEPDENGKKIQKDKNELLRLIEISILQQIFYHEKDENIPDSRFKKIKSYNSKRLLIISAGVFLFIISLLNQIYPHLIQGIFKDNLFNTLTRNLIHYGSIIILSGGVLYLTYKSIRIVTSLTINKLKFQNAEIEIGKNINKSILNHHLDEILYFFSVRPYNVVIIEDLDRFEETEIFTKLREINYLLNNSKKTMGKDIVFIYAVRDDMFSDNDRIKFFDFILPVIPVINSSNSSEILLKKKNEFNYQISDDFVEDISFFIDDMRLLHNISNEFHLYRQQLDEELNHEKLFAIILYKNIYPNDFVSLMKNEGDLYSLLNSVASYKTQAIEKIQIEISTIKEEIKFLDSVYFKNKKDLRLLYIVRIMEKLRDFNSFVINGKPHSIDDLTKDEAFEYLINNTVLYEQSYLNRPYNRIEYHTQNFGFKFQDIEEKVDPAKSYNEKSKAIIDINAGRANSLRVKIRQLESKKAQVRNLKLSEILRSHTDLKLEIGKNLNEDLINVLVRNGYIAEDYLDYISIFHEGSITRNDYKFLIKVKNHQYLEFEYKLTKIDKIVSKINLNDFETEFVFNYDLLDFILSNSESYNTQIELLFNKLADESKSSTDFVFGFIEDSRNLEIFIKTLCKNWHNIWNYISSESQFTSEKQKTLLIYILDHAEVLSIRDISELSDLKQTISNDEDFLSIFPNQEKLKEIIKELKIKFVGLDFENSPSELLDYIYENEYYEIDVNMISSIIKKYGDFNQVIFDKSNYRSIKNSNCEFLIQYINKNIDSYIQKIYLKIDTNTKEDESTLIDLIKHDKLSEENKILIIEKNDTKISNLSKIADRWIKDTLLELNKVEPKWENLLDHFNRSESIIGPSLVIFLNDIENAEVLSKIKMPTKVNNENLFGEFCKVLVQTDELDDEAFDLITRSIPWWYSDLMIEELSLGKVISLIENSVINPSIESYQQLKENFDDLHIRLIEKHPKTFLNLIDQVELDGEDLEIILESSTLANPIKNKFLNSCSNDTISSNDENFRLLSELILKDDIFKLDSYIIENILLSENVDLVNKIKIFNKSLLNVDFEFIDNFLLTLKNGYGEITNRNKKARIEDKSYNRELLNYLAQINYISSYKSTLLGLRVYHKKS